MSEFLNVNMGKGIRRGDYIIDCKEFVNDTRVIEYTKKVN